MSFYFRSSFTSNVWGDRPFTRFLVLNGSVVSPDTSLESLDCSQCLQHGRAAQLCAPLPRLSGGLTRSCDEGPRRVNALPWKMADLANGAHLE